VYGGLFSKQNRCTLKNTLSSTLKHTLKYDIISEMKLSILIASVHTRRNTFLPRILENVFSQYDLLSEAEQDEVEILMLLDNKKMMLGDKRNLMIDQAQGEYVVFVDDDDVIADDYISSILEATKENSDVITFQAEVTMNGADKKICYYSKDFSADRDTRTTYERLPNHICAIKKSIAQTVEFPAVLHGEDRPYAKLLKPLLNTQTIINNVLYYYLYQSETSEKQTLTQANRTYKTKRTHTS
jgi:glycosyltransferase involved in cell wall biosynthesis